MSVNLAEKLRFMSGIDKANYDGRRKRKQLVRRTVDFNSSLVQYLAARVAPRLHPDALFMQPNTAYGKFIMPPIACRTNPVETVPIRYLHTSINKHRCVVNVLTWTPEGRRIITGCATGEFTLWNGLTFNFETILHAHTSQVRAMCWRHDGEWLVSGDHSGIIKYWEPNMNNVNVIENEHKDVIRDISFSPTDAKMATACDDGTVKIWDFKLGKVERTLKAHRGDVKSLDWHPSKGLVASGSKDLDIILWDPRKDDGKISAIKLHNMDVLKTKWNRNGNWLLTSSKDKLIKLFDIRMMKEIACYKGHKEAVTTLAWHPIHELLFASGGADGMINHWMADCSDPVATVDNAHEKEVLDIQFHPLGHLMVSGSNDHTAKWWCRFRPGDTVENKYTGSQFRQSQHQDDFVGPNMGGGGHAGYSGNAHQSSRNMGGANRFSGNAPVIRDVREGNIPGMGDDGRRTYGTALPSQLDAWKEKQGTGGERKSRWS